MVTSTNPVPKRFWNASRFVAGFENLRVPITTASEAQIPDWQSHEVWDPYWKSIRDYCQSHPASEQLISTVMAKTTNPNLGTQAHRDLFQQWVDRYVPGYRIIWETDLIAELNEALATLGEKVSPFAYGKDGRGALPDRYYHLLAERKCLVVGNHHDILGHFLLFSDPEIRRITEKIVKVSADGHTLRQTFLNYQRVHFESDETQKQDFQRAVLDPLRPIFALLTYSWNLCQEKLYFSQAATDSTNSKFSLLGAFNTVYNTTLSSRLPVNLAGATVNGLGIVANQSNRNIVMLPRDMRRWLIRPTSERDSEKLKAKRIELSQKIASYAQTLQRVGWKGDPDQSEATALSDRFRQIVIETLFAQVGPFRLPMEMRWKRFGKAIQNEPIFSKLLTREAMLQLGEAQIEVAKSSIEYFAIYFADRSGVTVTRPSV